MAAIAHQHASCTERGRANFLKSVVRETPFQSKALERFEQPHRVVFELLFVCVAQSEGPLQGEQQQKSVLLRWQERCHARGASTCAEEE